VGVRRTLLSSANSAFMLGPAGAAGFAAAAGRSSRLPGPPGGLGGGGGGGPPLALGALPGAGALAAPAAGAEAAGVQRISGHVRILWLAAPHAFATQKSSMAGRPGLRPPEARGVLHALEHARLTLSCGCRQGCSACLTALLPLHQATASPDTLSSVPLPWQPTRQSAGRGPAPGPGAPAWNAASGTPRAFQTGPAGACFATKPLSARISPK